MGEDRRACSKSKFTRAARITILCMNFQPKTRQEIPKVRARLILVITVKLGLLLKRQGERLWKEFSPSKKLGEKLDGGGNRQFLVDNFDIYFEIYFSEI